MSPFAKPSWGIDLAEKILFLKKILFSPVLFFNPDVVLDLVSSGSSKRAKGQPGGRLEGGDTAEFSPPAIELQYQQSKASSNIKLEPFPSLLPHRSGVTPSYRIAGAQGAWPLLPAHMRWLRLEIPSPLLLKPFGTC